MLSQCQALCRYLQFASNISLAALYAVQRNTSYNFDAVNRLNDPDLLLIKCCLCTHNDSGHFEVRYGPAATFLNFKYRCLRRHWQSAACAYDFSDQKFP